MAQRFLRSLAVLAGLAASPAAAQFAPATYVAAVPVTASATATAALPTPGPFTTFCNTGTIAVYVRLGSGPVAATLGDNFLNAGTCRVFANISGPNYSMISTGGGSSVNLNSGACDRSSCGLGGGGGSGGGGGGGGTSSNFAAAFPSAGTAAGCEFLTSAPSYSVNAQMQPCTMSSVGNLLVDAPSNSALYAAVTADPCAGAKTNFSFGSSSASNIQLVAPVAAQQVYICSLSYRVGAPVAVNFIGGTGAACTTSNEEAIIGSTTAANGMLDAANSGEAWGSGAGYIMRTTTAGNGVCILLASAQAVAGGGTFVQK